MPKRFESAWQPPLVVSLYLYLYLYRGGINCTTCAGTYTYTQGV